jgi:Alginate export
MTSRLILAAMVVLMGDRLGSAQGAPPNPYRPNPADEDWTFLKNTPKTDVWDPVKYITLGKEDWSLTLSGEIRFRPEGFRIRKTAVRPATIDNYLLQRYFLGADFRFGPRVRVFAEAQSGIINGKFGSPRPTDRDSLDLHQAFVEVSQPVRRHNRLAFTAGRQEMEIGSSRLISASPGLNVKRSFDGIGLSYRTPSWRVSAGAAQLVGLATGMFDDRPDAGQVFWGVAAARDGQFLGRSQAGAYYLGIDRDESVFAQGIGPEVRHTIGVKLNGGDRLSLNYDVLFQWGRFAGAPIRAWAFATETAIRSTSMAWRPRFSIRADIASGDADKQQSDLQSFNPLFPGNSYSGAVGLVGPTNLTDFTPALTLTPHRALVVGIEAPSYWRTSTGDGVYATDLRLLLGPDVGTGRYFGTNPGLVVVWQATRHLQLQGVITRFLSGGFLDNTFVSEGFGFYSFTTRYRF